MASKEKFLQELKLRRLIRKAIKIRETKLRKNSQTMRGNEEKLRKLVRGLLKEGGDVDADTEPAPYKSTAMNMLIDVLNVVLPVIKTNLRKLTSGGEERVSYKEHIIQSFQDFFNNLNSNYQLGAEEDVEGVEVPDVEVGDETTITEADDIEIKIDDEPDEIDADDAAIRPPSEEIKKEKPTPEDKEDSEFEEFAMGGKNTIGARVAFDTINSSNMQSTIEKAYKILDSSEARQEYQQYFMYNIDLWLNKYEKELATELGQEPAFTENSVEKPVGAEIEPEVETGEDLGFELGGEGGEGELPPPV